MYTVALFDKESKFGHMIMFANLPSYALRVLVAWLSDSQKTMFGLSVCAVEMFSIHMNMKEIAKAFANIEVFL